jgi:hypothetical protein
MKMKKLLAGLLLSLASLASQAGTVIPGQQVINELIGAPLASASTVDLRAATGNFLHITGAATINTITLFAGAERTVIFDGAATLTNSASLVLPGVANIVTSAGDRAIFRGDASGVVRCISYIKADGSPVSLKGNIGTIDEQLGTAIPSAATVNLETATGNYIHVTGVTTITAITLNAGAERTVIFDGALTLTNGANLLLPGGSNITTAAGDRAIFRGDASSIVYCIAYVKAAGAGVAGAQLFTSSGTFTKPGGISGMTVIVIGAGGGGGGGFSFAGAGVTQGGGGGAGGSYVSRTYRASDIGATVSITVGAAGTGGAGGVAGGSGSNGTAGGNSSFGSLLAAFGGGRGTGGASGSDSPGGTGAGTAAAGMTGPGAGGLPSNSTMGSGSSGTQNAFAGGGGGTITPAGSAGNSEWGGAAGGSAALSGTANFAGGSSIYAGCGGGAGGGQGVNGAAGGVLGGYVAGGGGAGGTGSAGAPGANGPATGGGGGGGAANTAGVAGKGGNGGAFGDGGGGGGGANNNNTGGAGGTGGGGAVLITYW